MTLDNRAVIGKGTDSKNPDQSLDMRFANRHGLVTGATGSGKTVTMLRLVAEFNRLGVPCVLPDVKGDVVTRIRAAGSAGVDCRYLNPGINLRLSLLNLGPDLAARALGLTDAQQGMLERALVGGGVVHTPPQAWKHIATMKGEATRNAIKRQFMRVRPELFGQSFDVADLIDKQAPVTLINARELVEDGNLYCVHMIYMLRELMTRLPERGDAAAPVLAFFIDEAHMLFKDCPPRLLTELERVVRLIRSKGVSLWFVTQRPSDIPPVILGQLANRIQHSLRAATPADWKDVAVAVDTMPRPANADLDMQAMIGAMPPGMALVSVVGHTGTPSATSCVKVRAPEWFPPAEPATPALVQFDPETAEAVAPSDEERAPTAVPVVSVADARQAIAVGMRIGRALAPTVRFVFKVAAIVVGLTVAVVIALVSENKKKGRAHK